MSSNLRTEILKKIPAKHHEVLNDWINEIEDRLNIALGYFDISGISDLHKLDDANQLIYDLKNDLY